MDCIDQSDRGGNLFYELKKAHKNIAVWQDRRLLQLVRARAKVLEDRGILADLIPEVYDGESLGEALAVKLQRKKIVLPRARKGNQKLVKILKKQGGQVSDIPTYDTVYEKSSLIHIDREIESDSIDCVVFTSASTVKGFVEVPGFWITPKLLRHALENRQKLRQTIMECRHICQKKQPLIACRTGC